MPDDLSENAGQRIKALREAIGMSQEHLARLAGTSQQTVQRIETGATTWSKHLSKLNEILLHSNLRDETNRDPLARSYMQAYDEMKIRESTKTVEFHKQERINSIELLFSVEDDKKLLSANPKTFVTIDVGSKLINNKEIYALHMASSDMMPEFEAGDILIIDPKAAIINNVTCAFVRSIDGRLSMLIRRLISSNDMEWNIKDWHSDSSCNLSRSLWATCHRVTGRLMRG